MRILLDESTPHKLRLFLDDRHSVVTTWFQGWSGLKNGALLAAAEAAEFQLLITSDQALRYEQNLVGRNIAVLVLSTNNWGVIKSRIPEIAAAIDRISPGEFLFVEIGHARG